MSDTIAEHAVRGVSGLDKTRPSQGEEIYNRAPTPVPTTGTKETRYMEWVKENLLVARPLSPTPAPAGEHVWGRTEWIGSWGWSQKLKGTQAQGLVALGRGYPEQRGSHGAAAWITELQSARELEETLKSIGTYQSSGSSTEILFGVNSGVTSE